MTEQIKSFIEWFEELLTKEGLTESEVKHFQLAIRSLKAWEEVIEELENFDVDEYLKDDGHRFGFNEGICYVMELINQHLADIEEVR